MGDFLIWYLIFGVISIICFYFIIKNAVKNGMIAAQRELDRLAGLPKPSPSKKSAQQSSIENEAYRLYAKKKLPDIDYKAPIDEQREQFRQYVEKRMSESGKQPTTISGVDFQVE